MIFGKMQSEVLSLTHYVKNYFSWYFMVLIQSRNQLLGHTLSRTTLVGFLRISVSGLASDFFEGSAAGMETEKKVKLLFFPSQWIFTGCWWAGWSNWKVCVTKKIILLDWAQFSASDKWNHSANLLFWSCYKTLFSVCCATWYPLFLSRLVVFITFKHSFYCVIHAAEKTL